MYIKGGNTMKEFKSKLEMIDALYEAISFIENNYPEYSYVRSLAYELEDTVIKIREEITE